MASNAAESSGATASVHVVTYARHELWRGVGEIGRTRRLLAGCETVGFAVVGRCSAGAGARHVNRTLSTRRFVSLVDWADHEAAAAGRAELDARWRQHGATVWSAGLAPLRSKGRWRGATPFGRVASGDPRTQDPRPVASLTYARIRPTKLGHFYFIGFPPTARRMTGQDSPMLAGVGFGDVPIHHACTFSVWPSATELDRIVLGRSEPHGDVVRRSSEERWLSESMFVRFAVVDHTGTWGAGDPLR